MHTRDAEHAYNDRVDIIPADDGLIILMTDNMNPWLQFLIQHGAQLDAEGAGVVSGFTGPTLPSPSGWIAPLTDLGLLAASGDDASTFLHSQLTNDIAHLPPSTARLAGYCTAKGRLLASLMVWRDADAIVLQLPAELQAAIQKRLQMFVLRAKVKLQDLSAERVALGLAGSENVVREVLAPLFPSLPEAPFGKTDSTAGTLIRMPDAQGVARWQWIAPVAQAMQAWPQLALRLQPVGNVQWRLSEIRAGLPHILLATQEQFVPQMINFEVVGGINFKKGCYPGQEIVARSQYLGKLKRRMAAAVLPAEAGAAKPAMEVFHSEDPEQPCGMIVNAARSVTGETECLVELKLSALDRGSIHLGSAAGPALRLTALPYALPDSA